MPIYNWWQIHKTGKMDYLLRKLRKLKGWQAAGLQPQWNRLLDQHIMHFGLTETFQDIISKRKEIAIMKCDRWIEDDRSINTLIAVAEQELEKMLEKNSGDLLETKSQLESIRKHQIDMKHTTVTEFYTYINEANKRKSNNG